jgi:hypothetical protein
MLIAEQIGRAEANHPGVEFHRLADGNTVVSFQACLGPGWNLQRVLVQFVLPIPYPAAQPDCFYTDIALRLASGAMPANTGIQSLAGEALLWFSWHVATWTPQRDDVATYIRFIENRLRDAR